MFELLSNGTVEKLCNKIREKGVSYGFGGIAKIGGGLLPAERILCEHIRLKSKMVILSRAFFDQKQNLNPTDIKLTFNNEIKKLRDCEQEYSKYSYAQLQTLHKETSSIISTIASNLRKDM